MREKSLFTDWILSGEGQREGKRETADLIVLDLNKFVYVVQNILLLHVGVFEKSRESSTFYKWK